MTNSRSIQTLEDNGRAAYPGITIYDVGDEAHSRETSGHNHDDKPGVTAEDQDSDNKPEVRALDFMRGAKFSAAQAAALFEALTRRPENQARLLYVIYNRRIRSRTDGWVDRPYNGSNPHTDHVHASGRAEDDENTKPWNIGGNVALTTADISLLLNHNLSPSGTKVTVGQALLDAHRIWEIMPATAKNAAAAAGRADGLMNMADVITSWSTVNPTDVQENKLADAVLAAGGAATVDVAALAAALSQLLPEGVGLSKDDVREAFADVLKQGTNSVPTE